MGILDELLKEIPEEKDPATPPPAANADEPKGSETEKEWYSDEFKEYARIS